MNEAETLRLIVSLVFVVALILAGMWAIRRAGWIRGAQPGTFKVLSTQSLGARTYLAMVEVEDARLVLGVTANQVSLLHTLPPSDPAAIPEQPAATGFAAALGRAIKRH